MTNQNDQERLKKRERELVELVGEMREKILWVQRYFSESPGNENPEMVNLLEPIIKKADAVYKK